MKKIAAIIAVVFFATLCANAQKLVIGSEVEDHKKVESLEWLSEPQNRSSIWIIDFYAANNPTAVSFYDENISRIHSTVGGRAEIVLMTSKGSSEFSSLAERDGSKYAFAIDKKGEFHKLFGVRYIPFTVIVNHKGKILWQGNLSTLSDKIIEKVL